MSHFGLHNWINIASILLKITNKLDNFLELHWNQIMLRLDLRGQVSVFSFDAILWWYVLRIFHINRKLRLVDKYVQKFFKLWKTFLVKGSWNFIIRDLKFFKSCDNEQLHNILDNCFRILTEFLGRYNVHSKFWQVWNIVRVIVCACRQRALENAIRQISIRSQGSYRKSYCK